MTDRVEEVRSAIEAVARNDEAQLLRRSPFHLASCGGCGAPAFQQPCSICSYYPRGADKGTWHPKAATRDIFIEAVECSGPGRTGGTIATWHARRHENTASEAYRAKVRALVEAASMLEMPDAGTVWDVVAAERSLVRGAAPRHVHAGWRGFEEAMTLVSGEIGRGAPKLPGKAREIVQGWVAAVHNDDYAGMLAALEQGLALCRDIGYQAGRSGNLNMAAQYMREAEEILGASAPRP